MGPRLISRGDIVTLVVLAIIVVLQWGRG